MNYFNHGAEYNTNVTGTIFAYIADGPLFKPNSFCTSVKGRVSGALKPDSSGLVELNAIALICVS